LMASLEQAAGRRVLGISAVTGEGVPLLVRAMHRWLTNNTEPVG
jgi:hypothetical protein